MWLTLIMMVVSFFLSGGAKKGNRTKALITAGIVGAGTYYAVTQTDWGKSLDVLDNPAQQNVSAQPVLGPDGKPVLSPAGQPIYNQGPNGWDVLKSWGPTGTALVAGTVAAGTGSGIFGSIPPWLLVGGIGLAAVAVLRR